MSSSRLSFSSIQIRRMPGFTRYGTDFDTGVLSPGINVIYGPNGSGKTTVSRAISAVLWPDKGKEHNAEIQGRICLDDDEIIFELAGASRRCRADGQERELPALPPLKLSDSYNFALHVLMTDRNTPFAEEIEKESIGGFNISAAKSRLGFSSNPSSPRSLREALEAAEGDLSRARDEQAKLKEDEEQLEADRLQLANIDDACGEVARLELMLRCRQAQASVKEAQQLFEKYPDALASVSDGALDRAMAAEKEIEECRQSILAAQHTVEQTEQQIRELLLPEEGVEESLIGALEGLMVQLTQAEYDLQQEQRSFEEAETHLAAELERMGGVLSPEKLATLTPVELDRLQQFVEQSQSLKAERKACQAIEKWLGSPELDQETDALKEGIALLRRWLRASGTVTDDRSGKKARGIGVVSASLLAVLVFVLAFTQAWAWLGVLLLPAGIAVWTFLPSGSQTSSSRESHSNAYSELDLPQPATWCENDVTAVLSDLSDLLTKIKLEEDKAEILRGYDMRKEELAALAQQLDEQRNRLTNDLGLAADTGELALHVLAEAVSRWQTAHSRAAGNRTRCEDAATQAERLLGEINDALARYGYPEATKSSKGSEHIRDLNRRQQTSVTASQKFKAEEDRIEQLERQAENAAKRFKQEFEPLGLAEGDFAKLTEYCNQRASYEAADTELKKAQVALSVAETALGDADIDANSFQDMDPVALQKQLEEVKGRAKERDDIFDRISRAEERIRIAKHGHSVENALDARDRAVQALEEQREKACASVVGAAVADFLEAQVRDVSRPKVFRRAGEIFARITNAHYELRFREESTPPEFAAFDTVENEYKSLDELSSGTRLQLLLSVRIAFVEKFETDGVKLPLVFDEVLGNSDDTRAMAILDSVKALAESGRQIFYFTAQNDEVAKWRAALELWGGDTPAFIDLAEQRRLSGGASMTHEKAEWSVPELLPEPGSSTHAQYRDIINVPACNPYADLSSLHVWYLLSETSDIHALLKKGIHSWGQLQAMLRINDSLLPGGEVRIAEARKNARIIETYMENWRIGRGLPITAAVIQETGLVNDKYMDDVEAVITDTGGDAKRFLSRTAEIKGDGKTGPRSSTWEKVQIYLEENGYFDDSDILTDEEIRMRVLVSLTPAIPEEDIDAVLSRLTQ